MRMPENKKALLQPIIDRLKAVIKKTDHVQPNSFEIALSNEILETIEELQRLTGEYNGTTFSHAKWLNELPCNTEKSTKGLPQKQHKDKE